MSADLTIAPAAPDRSPIFAALHGTCFNRGWRAAEFEAFLHDNAVLGLEACLPSGELAGFIVVRRAGDEAEILTIAVAPALRRRGIGGALLQSIIAWLAGENILALFLEVAGDNAAALTLYRAQGFVDAGRRRAYYARTGMAAADALVLRLDLAAARY